MSLPICIPSSYLFAPDGQPVLFTKRNAPLCLSQEELPQPISSCQIDCLHYWVEKSAWSRFEHSIHHYEEEKPSRISTHYLPPAKSA